MSSSVQHFAESSKVHERRVSQRLLPKSLIYVACGESNGGMVLNVSDDGMAISMAIAVGDEAYSHLDVRMNGLPQSIEIPGRMVWTTKSKKRAGIQLVDVSDTQRQQIREWMALEGVRDVNLRPRVVSDGVAASNVITTDAVNPMVFAEPGSTLLDAFGGTVPETLGPPLPELFASQDQGEAPPPLPSQSFDDVSNAAFRENEWDLASVAMVPRKKPKPEGLSTFALMLLWIAIPSFAIGILVGRRPLEQWLARGDAAGKTLSRSPSSQKTSASLPDISPSGHQADVKFSPDLPSNLPINTEPFDTNVLSPKSGDNYRSADSSGSVDSKLLNSMSTQEARAFQKTTSSAPDASAGKNDFDKTDKSRLLADNSAPLPISPAKAVAVSPSAITSGTSSHPASATGAVPTTIATAAPPQNKAVTPPAAAPNSNSSLSMRRESISQNSAPVRQNGVAGSAPPAVLRANTPLAAASASPTAASSDSNRSAAQNVASSNGATLSASNSTASVASSAAPSSVAVTPPVAANVAAPGAGNVPPKSAPLSVQPVLHGVMTIARNTDQAFVLKLPAETVPGGQGASMRMQRFVMVPQRSRWHLHGAVAKLTVGELLTEVAPEKPDAKIQPRTGDTVTVRAFVDKDGNVRDLKPVSGRFALMPRVMRTVREWQFDQTRVDGKPVESEVNVTVEYRGAN